MWYAGWKEDWDRGLPLLAKGDDAEWKEAAAAELAAPRGAMEKKAVADRWWTLAATQPSRLAMTLRSHAAGWYDDALPDLKGDLQAEVEDRLKELGDEAGKVDLLKLIDVERAPSIGLFTREGKALITPKIPNARIQIPYIPPEEYRIAMRVERMGGMDSLVVYLVVQGRQCRVVFDGWTGSGIATSAIDLVDGRGGIQNETRTPGKILEQGVPAEIVITVRRGLVITEVNGKTIITFKGKPERLSLHPAEFLPNPDTLRVGSWDAVHRITKMELTPLRGRGRKIANPPQPEPVKDGVYVSDLTPESVWVGWPQFGTNGHLGYDGADKDNRIRSNWVWYRKAISPHPGRDSAPSKVVYGLDGKYSSFSTMAALNDDMPAARSPITFQVLVDGIEKWKSPELSAKGATAKCDINVTKAHKLELRIWCANNQMAHGVWLDPVLRP
jgi:hypothetical protein